MVGEWVDESSDSIIHANCRWSDDKNFLLRDFVIQVQGRPMMKVTQRIGWDPLTEQIKSWVLRFRRGLRPGTLDAGTAISGRIKSTGVLPDGRIATATNILTRTGPNTGPLGLDRTDRGRRGLPPIIPSRSWSAGPRRRRARAPAIK